MLGTIRPLGAIEPLYPSGDFIWLILISERLPPAAGTIATQETVAVGALRSAARAGDSRGLGVAIGVTMGVGIGVEVRAVNEPIRHGKMGRSP